MADEKKNPLGPTGEQVRDNVLRIREARGMTKKQLADRVQELGRPIPPLGISRIEAGTRRVDADDLVALAIALNVTPLALLLPAHGGADPYIDLTSATTTTVSRAWKWARGDNALPDSPGEDAPQEKQDAYEWLSHSAGQRYVKREPAGRAVDVLHQEVYRLVELSGVSTERIDEEFGKRLEAVRVWLDRLTAEVNRAAAEHGELSASARQWMEQQERERAEGKSENG
ncbi:helix-turn-helix domain-containing protein [Streptomyces sp. NPDC127159]|uniref:helix-turn-helix domain-containing protein n=1 Tax=unclassified Streptomyces TaxID=2593676 RepID=UPI00362F648B